MIYTEFRSMILNAAEFSDADSFLAECGGSFTKEFSSYDYSFVKSSVDFVFSYSHNKSFRSIVDFLGVSLAEYARRTDIPLRTVESWASGDRTPPAYLLDLLACNAVEEMLK